MQIYVSKIIIIGSDTGSSPRRRLAIVWTNAERLLIWPWVTKLSEILIEIQTFSFTKMNLKMSPVSEMTAFFVPASMC